MQVITSPQHYGVSPYALNEQQHSSVPIAVDQEIQVQVIQEDI
jgi:hypothetical protein